MQQFKMNTNFGQLQRLIGDLSTQQGCVRSDPQKGDNTFIYWKTLSAHNKADFT